MKTIGERTRKGVEERKASRREKWVRDGGRGKRKRGGGRKRERREW